MKAKPTLGWQRTADAIGSFVREFGACGPRRAVFCTYEFDQSRFQAVVLPEISRARRWFRTLVLADQGALQRGTALERSRSTYQLAPVRLAGRGVFHPKLIVLQAGEHVLTGIGSANLTAGGLGGRLELMRFTADRATAAAAIEFLDRLRSTGRIIIPKTASAFIERIVVSTTHRPGPLLHSLSEPLLTQMRRSLPKDVRRVVVVSPWHSAGSSPGGVEPNVLERLRTSFGASPEIHTEGVGGKAPNLGKCATHVLKATILDGDDSESDDNQRTRPTSLHAKAYWVRGRTNMLWFGSANCTHPALLDTVEGNGNVELLAPVTVDRAGATAFETDLEAMFEECAETFDIEKPTPIEQPKGIILCGNIERDTIVLELARTVRSVRVATSLTSTPFTVRAQGHVAVLRNLRAAEPPGVLFEVVGRTRVPFPVVSPLVVQNGDAKDVLQDLLDDLAARPPTKTGRPEDDETTGSDDELDDTESSLLTKSEHQGYLDRYAVRVALLARRVRLLPASMQKSIRAYCRAEVAKLPLSEELRSVLVGHLEKS